MIAKLKRKTIVISVFSLMAVALVVFFAVPAIAAELSAPRADFSRNITNVQGTIVSINSNSIVIKTGGNPSTQITLGLNDSTNFNIHGTGWLNSNLNGDNVTAVYSNDQKVTPPVASQITINMPAPVAPSVQAPVPGPNMTFTRSMASVQGALTVNSGRTITVTPTNGTPVGPLTITDNTSIILYGATITQAGANVIASLTLSGNSTVNYDSQKKEVNQITINVPAPIARPNIVIPTPIPTPVPGKDNAQSFRTVASVQGTMTVNSNGTIIVTSTKGTAVGPLTLDSNTRIESYGAILTQNGSKITASITLKGAVSVTYNNQTNVASQIMMTVPIPIFPKMPATIPNIIPTPPGRQAIPGPDSNLSGNSRI